MLALHHNRVRHSVQSLVHMRIQCLEALQVDRQMDVMIALGVNISYQYRF